MLIETLFNIWKSQNPRLAVDIDHFSIEQIGSKYYVYAHQKDTEIITKIGTYKSYECAKKAIDNILDLKIKDYGS